MQLSLHLKIQSLCLTRHYHVASLVLVDFFPLDAFSSKSQRMNEISLLRFIAVFLKMTEGIIYFTNFSNYVFQFSMVSKILLGFELIR